MQKIAVLLLFLTCSTHLLTAQSTTRIHGIVKDSLRVVLESASVTVIDQNGAGLSFAKTDHEGFFDMLFPRNEKHLSLKITYIGYQQLVVPLSEISYYPYVAVLKVTNNRLSEIIVKSNNKISLSSDTVKYNVNAFKDQNDRAIADLIARLPGIQVDDNGAISYNGKRISTVYIDGDNLLDGRYRSVTNNVPVDAVEQVQVIERDQPIKALNGYTVASNVALNLKITEHARTVMINTGFIGLGNKAYTGEFNNLTLKKSIKSVNNIKANNIGQNLQAEQAYIGVSSNSDEINLRTPVSYLTMMSGTLPSLEEKYYLMNNDNSGNINGLYKLKSDWALRLNIAVLELRRQYNYNNSVNYFLPNADTVRYQEIQDAIEKISQWQIGAQIEKNSNSMYLKSNTKLDLPKWNRSGRTTQNSFEFEQIQPTSQLSLSNETNLTKAIAVDQVLQYNSVLQFYKTNENLKISPGVQQDIVNDSTDYKMLNQQVGTKNLFVNQSATYKTKFARFILSSSLGINYEHNTLRTDLFKIDSLNGSSIVGRNFRNNLVFTNTALYGKAALTHLFEKGSLSLEAAPAYNFINYNAADTERKTFFRVNPAFVFRNKIRKYSELDFRYSQQSIFGEIEDIYTGTILSSYRQFSTNNTHLPKIDIHSIGVRYAYRKPLNMLFYAASLNYDRSSQNFINSYIIDAGVTKAIAVDYRNVTDKYALSGNISKYIFWFDANISASGNVGLQKGNSLYNNEIAAVNAYHMNISLTARKKIVSKIMLSLTGDLGKLINEQSTSADLLIKNISELTRIKAEWQQNVSDQIAYTIVNNFTSYKQASKQKISNSFLDVNVKYSPTKWKSFFELQCMNLINQSVYQQINSDSNQFSIFQLPLRPRTFFLKYSFTF